MRFSLTTTLGLSLVLLCGLTNAETPTTFELNHSVNGDNTFQDFNIEDYSFGTTTFLDGDLGDPAPNSFPLRVDSGPSSGGFDFEVVFDYTSYDIGFFQNGVVTGSFVGIGLPISDVFVSGPEGSEFGNFSTDGSTIFFDYTAADVVSIGEGEVTISFSTQAVPEPSSAMIIGLAGLCFAARRRR